MKIKAKDKSLNVFLHARVMAMVGALNLYLDPDLSYTWREASLIASKAQGHGIYHSRNIRKWILQFLTTGELPLHRYQGTRSEILQHEDISSLIKLKLIERCKNGFINASEVVNIVASQEIQEMLEDADINQCSISEHTGREWLKKLDYRYHHKRNGMYIDGHEHEDIVEYCTKFVNRIMSLYTPRMSTCDNAVLYTPPPVRSDSLESDQSPIGIR